MSDAVFGTGLRRGPSEVVVGPCHTQATARGLLGLNEAQVVHMVIARRLLALPTPDGEVAYPIWQFGLAGRVHAGLGDVLRALAAGTDDPWIWEGWLRAANTELAGLSPALWLAAGRPTEQVRTPARRVAADWRS